MARRALMALVLGALGQSAMGIGFGKLPSSANLGEPLQLEIALRLEPGEDINTNCVTADVAFADNHQAPGSVVIRLDPALPGATDRVLRLVTAARVDEPLVTVDLRVGCTSTVARRFTLFADPPLFTAAADPGRASAAAATSAVPAPVASAPTAEPVAAMAGDAAKPSSTADSSPVETAQPVPPRRPSAAAGNTPRPAGSLRPPRAAAPAVARAPRASTAAPAAAGRSRLQVAPLEPSAALAPTPGELAASAAAAERAATAASAAQAEAEARAKVDQLTAVVAKLQSEGDAAAKRIAALEARLAAQPAAAAAAAGDAPSRSWLYLLLAALALLLLVVLWLVGQRRSQRAPKSWMQPTVLRPAEGEPVDSDMPSDQFFDDAPPAVTAGAALAAARPSGHGALGTFRPPVPIAPSPSTLAAAPPLGAPAMPPLAAATSPAAALRELSVEELLDLEQQAEFFLVLGQDDAAIDLLLNHLVNTAGSSPLPYLKLLEIYKRRDERGNYEQLRERFNKRFNAYAPSWETDLQAGHSLEDYPPVMRRLEALWFDPQRAMTVLEATLTRPNTAGDDDAAIRDSFDLPAYRELLLLYSVARDRAEVEESAPVDLQLPIGDDAAPGNYGGTYERLLATTPLQAQPAVQRPLEVDLALDELEAETDPGMLHLPALDPPNPASEAGKADRAPPGPAAGGSGWSPLGPDNRRR